MLYFYSWSAGGASRFIKGKIPNMKSNTTVLHTTRVVVKMAATKKKREIFECRAKSIFLVNLGMLAEQIQKVKFSPPNIIFLFVARR